MLLRSLYLATFCFLPAFISIDILITYYLSFTFCAHDCCRCGGGRCVSVPNAFCVCSLWPMCECICVCMCCLLCDGDNRFGSDDDGDSDDQETRARSNLAFLSLLPREPKRQLFAVIATVDNSKVSTSVCQCLGLYCRCFWCISAQCWDVAPFPLHSTWVPAKCELIQFQRMRDAAQCAHLFSMHASISFMCNDEKTSLKDTHKSYGHGEEIAWRVHTRIILLVPNNMKNNQPASKY